MNKKTEIELANRIAQKLHRANIQFQQGAPIGGIRADFLINSPDGRLFAVETKPFSRRISDNLIAGQRATLLQKAAGVDGAYVVIDRHPSLPSHGIVSENDLIDELLSKFKKEERRKKTRVITKSRTKHKTIIFAAMPFSSAYEDVFFVAMAYAAQSVDAICERVDFDDFEGDIVERIRSLIRQSVAVIADLSEAKPNVLYEVGYAHALERPTIHICSTPLEQLPFDVRNWKTIRYAKGQTHKLRTDLTRKLKAILQ